MRLLIISAYFRQRSSLIRHSVSGCVLCVSASGFFLRLVWGPMHSILFHCRKRQNEFNARRMYPISSKRWNNEPCNRSAQPARAMHAVRRDREEAMQRKQCKNGKMRRRWREKKLIRLATILLAKMSFNSVKNVLKGIVLLLALHIY